MLRLVIGNDNTKTKGLKMLSSCSFTFTILKSMNIYCFEMLTPYNSNGGKFHKRQ